MLDYESISVIIPALNEEQSLPFVLQSIPSWVDETIVVDNGSIDQTAAVAQRHGARVIAEPKRGYGAACLAGIEAASGADILVFLDADFSDHPDQMHRLVAPITRGEADLVIGSRTSGHHQRGALTIQQRWGNALACGLMRVFWQFQYSDLGPFRAIRENALRRLSMDDQSYGWTIQMQIRALRAGLRVAEAPVDYRRRIGTSKISGTIGGVVRAGAKILGTVAAERARPVDLLPPEAAQEHLIAFTRCPESGQVKTRLISTLGADGAADLHRQMTTHTLTVIDKAARMRGASVEVRFTGGDRGRMRAMFGSKRTYRRQAGGDLGSRIHRAFADAFDGGASRIVITGTDCPAMAPAHVANALAKLQDSDVVLGPAQDGGYYLIGLRRPYPELFSSIDWGTSRVFAQTIERADSLGLSLITLDSLSDVDEPGDLAEWSGRKAHDALDESVPRVSVVIPTLNEARQIAACIASIPRDQDVEIIVADGGSHDQTIELARSLGAVTLSATRGRAAQMNAGAAIARGELLLFLHADTRLPANGLSEVARLLAHPDVALAAFRLGIDHHSVALRCIEVLANFRSKCLGMPYGDQALAVRTSLFRALDGYANMPFFEDFDFVTRVHRHGSIKVSRLSVKTSARRWLRGGVFRTTLRNQLCIAGYLCGFSPQHLMGLRAGKHQTRSGHSQFGLQCGMDTLGTAQQSASQAVETVADAAADMALRHHDMTARS